MSTHTGTYRHKSTHIDAIDTHRMPSIPIDSYRHLTIPIDTYWSLSKLVNVYQCLSMPTDTRMVRQGSTKTGTGMLGASSGVSTYAGRLLNLHRTTCKFVLSLPLPSLSGPMHIVTYWYTSAHIFTHRSIWIRIDTYRRYRCISIQIGTYQHVWIHIDTHEHMSTHFDSYW